MGGGPLSAFSDFIGKDCFRIQQAAMVRKDEMTPELTRLQRDWRQLPFIIAAGLVIGLLIGEAAALYADSSFAQSNNPQLHKAAKRAG